MPSLTNVIKRFEGFYLSLPRVLAEGGLLVLLLLVEWVDYLTGRNLHLALFYACICGFIGWLRGTRAVLATALLCLVMALGGDRLADPSVSPAFDVIDHVSRSLLWILVGVVMVSLRSRLDELDDAYETIHQDMTAARIVQKAFLSKELPTDNRIDLAVQFRPAHLLGGDYFQVRITDDELMALVADVSGKGAPAALVTGLLSGLFSEISRRHASPSKVLEVLDKEISGSLPDSMFVTAFYMICDLNSGLTRYASAGHDPPILWQTEGGLSELASTGLPVGLLSGFGLEEKSFKLDPGDTLVLFTDGLINAKLPGGGRLSDAALLAQVEANALQDSSLVTRNLLDFVDSQGETDDDVVILTIKRPLTIER